MKRRTRLLTGQQWRLRWRTLKLDHIVYSNNHDWRNYGNVDTNYITQLWIGPWLWETYWTKRMPL